MELIDKSAVVAEIERRLWLLVPKMTFHQQRVELEKLLSFIDTLEVKEVNLEKEIEKYAYSLPHSVTGTTSYVSDIKSPIAREFGIKHDWSYEYVKQIALHFFELGMTVSNKAQKRA